MAGRPRAGKRKNLPTKPSPEKKKELKGKPAIIKEGTRAYQIFDMLTNKGMSKDEVCEELDITMSSLESTLSSAFNTLQKKTLEIAENFVVISMDRSEKFQQAIMRELAESKTVDRDLVNSFIKITELQQDLLGMKSKGDSGTQVNIQNNIGMIPSNSPLYNQAVAEMQIKQNGQVLDAWAQYAPEEDVDIVDVELGGSVVD